MSYRPGAYLYHAKCWVSLKITRVLKDQNRTPTTPGFPLSKHVAKSENNVPLAYGLTKGKTGCPPWPLGGPAKTGCSVPTVNTKGKTGCNVLFIVIVIAIYLYY